MNRIFLPQYLLKLILGCSLVLIWLSCVEETSEEPSETGADASDAGFELNATDVLFMDINIPGIDIDIPPQCFTDEECAVEGEDSPCQKRICHPTEKSCVALNTNEGIECDMDNACVTSSLCAGGVCVAANREAYVVCEDNNFCTDDYCDPDDGCVFSPLDSGICDDGDPCTKDDYCDDGVCISGIDSCPAQCGDGACQTEKQETCANCELDCGPCSNGCLESEFAGCGGCGCESCVCEQKPECCTDKWTSECALICKDNCGVSQDGCSASPVGECCGCGCESCVCEKEPSCCDEAWSDKCVTMCALECGGSCEGFCGDGTCDAPSENCENCAQDCGNCSQGCAAGPDTGCDGCDCEACVCDLVPSCCSEPWSDLCATACQNQCGGNCPQTP